VAPALALAADGFSRDRSPFFLFFLRTFLAATTQQIAQGALFAQRALPSQNVQLTLPSHAHFETTRCFLLLFLMWDAVFISIFASYFK
jgi:hypothetical protein